MYLHIYLTYIFCANGANLTAEMGSEGSIAWPEWERWHFHEKISKVPPPKMVPPPSTFPLEPFSSKLVFLTGLEKSSSIWLFSSNEWALGRAMHEMSYFPRKFPPQLSCCCCPKGWLQALPRIRGGGHHTHEYKKAKRFQKILCRAVVTYKRRPLTSNCKSSSIVVFIHTS